MTSASSGHMIWAEDGTASACSRQVHSSVILILITYNLVHVKYQYMYMYIFTYIVYTDNSSIMCHTGGSHNKYIITIQLSIQI